MCEAMHWVLSGDCLSIQRQGTVGKWGFHGGPDDSGLGC